MSKILLMSIAGANRRSLTGEVFHLLSEVEARILDVDQSVIQHHLSLRLLIEANPQVDMNAIKDKLIDLVSPCEAFFTDVSADEYRLWADDKEKSRYLVTVLGRDIYSQHLDGVAKALSKHPGLFLETVNRLSGRTPLTDRPDPIKACIQFGLKGKVEDIVALKADLRKISDSNEVDVTFHANDVYHRNRRLAVFDMDSTLIQTEVINELADRAGVGEEVAAITQAAMEGKLDFKQSFEKRVGLLKGLDESVLAEISKNLPITEGVELMTRTLKRLGYKLAILSGGFEYFANDLKERFGFDYVYANQLEIVDGKVTGRVTGDVVDGARKAELLKYLAQNEGILLEQTIAVGDGANDLPMLALSGLGVAFHAKPIVREEAQNSISQLGLDALLYLIGVRDRELA